MPIFSLHIRSFSSLFSCSLYIYIYMLTLLFKCCAKELAIHSTSCSNSKFNDINYQIPIVYEASLYLEYSTSSCSHSNFIELLIFLCSRFLFQLNRLDKFFFVNQTMNLQHIDQIIFVCSINTNGVEDSYCYHQVQVKLYSSHSYIQ